MQRRSFILGTVASMAVDPAFASAPQPTSAAARIGQRILSSFPSNILSELQLIASDLHRKPDAALGKRVAADHRSGRVIKVEGVSFSVTEAAWCLAAAERSFLS